jgi:hypothetical protein
MNRPVPMLSAGSLLRLRRLDGRRKRLLFRTAVVLTAASAAVALLPFRRAIRFGSVPLGPDSVAIADCVWAIAVASHWLPWRTACIEKGLACQRLLRGAGLNAVLHYGARHLDEKLEAHVWVSVGGETIMGGEHAADFAELATFP